jgi:hypothetical protein
MGQLPAPQAVPWDSLGRVPIALITGTNGKTTTARLLARIARVAGHTPGNTSTDGMAIDGRAIEAGDWTGPGAARTVLRHPAVDLAVLEVARGGILRRGLGVDRCEVAAILNISADHLGEYGIHTLADMTPRQGRRRQRRRSRTAASCSVPTARRSSSWSPRPHLRPPRSCGSR